MTKTFTSLVVVEFAINNYEAESKEEYIDILKTQYLEEHNRELPGSSLSDLEEVYELLEQIVNYEPTDQEMMSSFGTKYHDGL